VLAAAAEEHVAAEAGVETEAGAGAVAAARPSRATCPETPGSPLAFAFATGGMESTPIRASSPATGRETGRPGATERRCPWRTSSGD
jgi:hypothetical protein